MSVKLILPINTKAPDSDLIDGIDSSQLATNSFATLKVGSTEVQADSNADIIEIAAGSNVAIVPDPVNDKITIGIQEDTEHRFVSDNKIADWDSKQAALGYTPINKSGDIMTGQLEAPVIKTPTIDLGGFKLTYNPITQSLDIGVD